MSGISMVGCRWCGSAAGEVVLDLGSQPSCDYFPKVGTPGPDASHPLRLWSCHGCGLAQLADESPLAEQPLGQEPQALVQQAVQALELAAGAGLLPAGARVAEAGSPHGGSWRGLLAERGLSDVSDDSQTPADVVIDIFGLMHEADQREALGRRVRRLRQDGLLLLQYHSLATIVARNQWNAVRHGHFAYYSTTALVGMLRRHDLRPVTIMRFALYGGTYLLAVQRGGVSDGRVEKVLEDERAADIGTAAGLQELGCGLRRSVRGLRRHLSKAAADGRPVLGYAAASSAVPLLAAADVGPELLPLVADASPAKCGRALPGCRIPIVEPAELVRRRPAEVLLFVPDLLAEARASLPEIEAGGGRWLVADPEVRAVPPAGSVQRRAAALVGQAPAPVTIGPAGV